MKLAITSLLALTAICQIACGPPGVDPAAHQSRIVGKWRSADGNYVVEFLPTGNCSARYRLQGHDLGGPCTYSVDPENITIHYYGLGANPQDGPPNNSVEWRYTLSGGKLSVSIGGVGLILERIH